MKRIREHLKIRKFIIILFAILPNPFFCISQTIKIGNQIWSVKNLNVSKFRNGDVIQEAKTDEEWTKAINEKQPAWCYFNNNSVNGVKYGKLYNWYAVSDPRGLAPEGWHIPSFEEWVELINFLKIQLPKDYRGSSQGGNKLKSKQGWKYVHCNGTNESGFTGLPGGIRNNGELFINIGTQGIWWSFSDNEIIKQYGDNGSIRCLSLGFNNTSDIEWSTCWKNSSGLSIRCVKD
jgi:uncharacterized protein (TIGR02145 family)